MREQLTPTAAVRTTLPCPSGPLAALDADPSHTGRVRVGTVLLLPGYTGSKEDFAPILDPLCSNGFRALAVDLPGQFESPGPDDEGAYAPLALGKVVAGVVTELASTGPLVLLGHSYGGLVARGAVLARAGLPHAGLAHAGPDDAGLAGAGPAGLILLDSGPAAFRFGQRYEALRVGEPIMREHGKTVVYDNTVATGRASRKTVPPEVAELLRRRFIASSQAGLLGMGAALQREPDRVDELHAALTSAGTPVAVIAGRDDDAWPVPDQQEMAHRLGTDLILIDDAAHSPAVENPAGLLAVLLPLLHSWIAAG